MDRVFVAVGLRVLALGFLMKTLISTSLVTLALLAAAPSVGFADGQWSARRIAAQNIHGKAHANKWRRWHHERGLPATAVPELDPNAAGQGLAFLLAATALLIDRRRAVRV